MVDETRPEPPASSTEKTPQDIPTIQVHDLMPNSREAVLIHGGERYRLRITAKDKLLLTK